MHAAIFSSPFYEHTNTYTGHAHTVAVVLHQEKQCLRSMRKYMYSAIILHGIRVLVQSVCEE